MKTLAKLGLAMLGASAAAGIYRRLQKPKNRDIDGQTALITGSSKGLGFLLAREYARQGCQVVICARDEQELEEARRRLFSDGAEVLAIGCDVSKKEQVQALIDEATDYFGGIDILVNNAGVIQVGPAEEVTLEDFQEALGTMFYGTLLPTWAVLPQMMKRGDGRIVNITSIGARFSMPHLLPYSSAKFAARGLSQGLRAELSRHDISVTTIVPGLMRTGSFVNALFKGRRSGEYAWFSLASSLPLITINAERAAEQIVRASKDRKAEYIVGVPFRAAAVFAGLFPGVTADVMGAVNSLILPAPMGGETAPVPGALIKERLQKPVSRILDVGTALARRVGPDYNQQAMSTGNRR